MRGCVDELEHGGVMDLCIDDSVSLQAWCPRSSATPPRWPAGGWARRWAP